MDKLVDFNFGRCYTLFVSAYKLLEGDLTNPPKSDVSSAHPSSTALSSLNPP